MIAILMFVLSLTSVEVTECSPAIAPVQAARVCTVVSRGVAYAVKDSDVVNGQVSESRLTCKVRSSLRGQRMAMLADGSTWRRDCLFLIEK